MIQEKLTVGAGTEYPLQGLLTLPEGGTPCPAVVMVHGSGPSNMDEKVMKLTPFRDLAEGLARHGVASLRYDKRTFAHARKMKKLSPTVREETVDDAILAVKLAKQDPRIDPERVFLLGHSMGAMLAPRIDADGADARGLILLAGSPYRLEEIVLRQLKRAGEGGSFFLRRIVGLEYRTYAKKFDGLYQMSDEEAKRRRFAGNLTIYYFKEMGQKTAADYLLESSKPALLLQGGRDFQVLAQDDFKAFRALLAERENTAYRLFPDLNHLFVPAIYDDILKASKEYKTERHIGEEVISAVASFVLEN